uniref:K Homology domain-containing protein n=1 Tax=Ditylenchus dipsaci TaxID=166011 RepID=A0A915D1S0_9BILA
MRTINYITGAKLELKTAATKQVDSAEGVLVLTGSSKQVLRALGILKRMFSIKKLESRIPPIIDPVETISAKDLSGAHKNIKLDFDILFLHQIFLHQIFLHHSSLRLPMWVLVLLFRNRLAGTKLAVMKELRILMSRLFHSFHFRISLQKEFVDLLSKKMGPLLHLLLLNRYYTVLMDHLCRFFVEASTSSLAGSSLLSPVAMLESIRSSAAIYRSTDFMSGPRSLPNTQSFVPVTASGANRSYLFDSGPRSVPNSQAFSPLLADDVTRSRKRKNDVEAGGDANGFDKIEPPSKRNRIWNFIIGIFTKKSPKDNSL